MIVSDLFIQFHFGHFQNPNFQLLAFNDHYQKMKLDFVSLEKPEWQIQVLDYKPPDKDERSRFSAKVNNNQLIVMQMTSVDDSLGHDLEMMTLCSGSLETEILPLLTSSVTSATEACVMFYIDKIGHQVMYR